ncbi:transmembrane protein 241 [Poecilia latipinna]|uniref:Transmembrane protein 241 n=1 Tax=Poecilia formosa TaxID=48698 RepID=A0A087XSV5_POEFO|nr:PREDICTED: transmembrane protein 241 [Poecilia formosa]XP_014880420.1 PREDICTED: transmembrane protein 241 [Poecilia latipinna]
MHWRSHVSGLAFSFVFIVSYFTNKFVLSVLKFTYPTLFQGWQTFIGAALLLLSGKLGWVEMSRIPRSAALSWLPGSFLFVGNIYAGSRALSRIDIPFFFTLQNSSHVVSYIIARAVHREKTQRLKIISVFLLLLSAINLPLHDPQFDHSGYVWALCHLFCVGAYRVFQVHKSTNLSDIEQQCINYWFSVLLLGLAAHPTGDISGALEFPSLQSHTFHCGCCASALLGFLLLLATVRLKRGPSLEHFRIWVFLSKVAAMLLSPLVFNMDFNSASLLCVVGSHVGEALLLYSDRESPP